MRLSRRTRLAGVALLAAVGLTLSACSGGGGDDENSSGSTDAVITANSSEPQNPLVPTNTNETGGGNIIDLIFAGLVSYKADGSQELEVADSIESDDNQNWTIKLKDWEFSDGTKVTAKSFVDAWNYGALSTNAQLSSYFFEPIEGYAAVSAEKPTAQTMSGLKVVDDKTFTVKLSQPESDFPLRLGYSAYFPLPESAFSDMKAFGQKPIGNGPYKLDSWEHQVEAKLVPNDKYDGNRKPKNGGVTYKFYQDLDAAYTDLGAGNLDVLDTVPDSALTTYTTDDSIQAFSEPGSLFQSFTIPEKAKHWGGEEGALRRQAISYAINRDEVTDKIFAKTRTPAKDFSSPLMPGYTDKIPGNEVLTFDAAKAKELWAEADKISPFEGSFQIAYNADGGHKAWVDAVTNQVKNTLGIDASGKPYPTFDQLRKDVTDRTIKTAFRTGWQPDYPSIANYLGPLYGTGAGSNDGDYSSPEFDAAIKKAQSASDEDARNEDLVAAQAILMKDLPAIPLWYSNIAAAAAQGVKDVKFNWQNKPMLENVTK